MSKLKKATLVLSLLALGACGKSKSTTTPVKPATDKTVTALPQQTPQPEANPQTPTSDTKKQTDVKQTQDAIVTTTKTQETKQTAPTIEQPAAKEVDFSPKVVGLGSATLKPEDLLNQGYDGAILRAKFCSVTGKFNNDGSRCYLVYSDGNTEYQSPENREKILAYVEQLKSEKAAQDQKSSKKKTN